MSSPPSTLGQYQIIREIARSNDIVYEAYDPLMNRRVAVKELAMPTGATAQQKEERIARFRREAQAAGTLNHPNIMTVYSFAEDAGRTFMAMEYLDGTTLRSEIDTKGVLPVDRAIEIALEVLEGLEHAHSKGVIHRDIKPDNIQICSNGQIKITDFGIARLTFQPNLTMDGQVFGTPSYMSPEQVVGREIDARSDLFSVGVLLYEMLTGQKPFAGDSVVTITYAIMNKEPDQPANVPYSLWQVISRSLDKSAQMRFPSASDMSKALVNATRMDGPVQPVMAPPVVNPYAPTAGPNLSPYNPYSQPSAPGVPNTNPYGGPQMGPPPIVNQAPIAYPYNPYQSPNAPPVVAQPGMPPPAAMPVFYPPPPRQPLMKPETVVFVKKLILTVLVVGTLFLLVTVGLQELLKAVQRMDAEKRDERLKSGLTQMDPNTPVEERIQKLSAVRDRLESGATRNTANQNLAVLYEEKGQALMKSGDLIHSEESLNRAVELDPHNPLLFTSLAQLYMMQAQKANDPAMAADLWGKCGEAYRTAVSQESDSKTRDQWREYGATAYNQRASALASAGDKSEARHALEDARDLAPSGSDIISRIDAYLAYLR